MRRRGESGFEEFLMHHIATCALCFSFVLANFMGVGATVLFIHDIADIFIAAAKTASCTRYEMATLLFFAQTIVSWFITHLVWFPFYIATIAFNEKATYPDHLLHFNPAILLNVIFLSALQVLHIYWFYLMIKMLVERITSGEIVDCVENVEMDIKNQS